MVKLTDPKEQPARDMGERGSHRSTHPRRHHNWGARSRRSLFMYPCDEPTGLLQLEELAMRSVKLLAKYIPVTEHSYYKSMDLLRLQYNLNFIVVCEKCGGLHENDELLAPER